MTLKVTRRRRRKN